jgi:hypothetical protein
MNEPTLAPTRAPTNGDNTVDDTMVVAMAAPRAAPPAAPTPILSFFRSFESDIGISVTPPHDISQLRSSKV